MKSRLTFLILFLAILAALNGCRGDAPRSTPEQGVSASSQPSAAPRASPGVVPATPKDWPMHLRDFAGTGHTAHFSLLPPLYLRWKYKTGGPLTASPIVVQRTVYIGSHDGTFYALRADTWGERWRFDTGILIRYTAAYWNGNVYFTASGQGSSRLYALNATTGGLIWQYELPAWTASALRVDRGVVYVAGYPSTIYRFDALTGRVRSEEQTRTRIGNADYLSSQGELKPSPPAHTPDGWQEQVPYSTSIPVDANGTLYVGSSDGKLYALQRGTWKILWEYVTQGPIEAPAAIADNAIFFGSRDGYLYALDRTERAPREAGALGTVTHNRAPLREAPTADAPLRQYLQDGTRLPILATEADWYQIQLPNGEQGWLYQDDFAHLATEGEVFYDVNRIAEVESFELPQGAEYPLWSPDGKQIAFFRRLNLSGQYWNANELWTIDAALTAPRKLCSGLFYNPNLSWSLDSKWLTFESTEANRAYVWVVQRSGHDLNRLAEGDTPRFSPRSHHIAYRWWQEGIDTLWLTTINGSGSRALHSVPIEGTVRQFTYLEPVSWSPDGERIAFGVDGQHYADGKSRILILNMDGEVVQQVLTRSGSVQAIRWSPSMRYLAFVLGRNPDQELNGQTDYRLNVKDLSAADAPMKLPAADGVWSPDGDWIATIEREPCAGIDWKLALRQMRTGRTIPLARMNVPLRSIQWVSGDAIALWATSGYIRDGKYQPALTQGWRLHLKTSLGD